MTSNLIVGETLRTMEIEYPNKTLQTTLKNDHFIIFMLLTNILDNNKQKKMKIYKHILKLIESQGGTKYSPADL